MELIKIWVEAQAVDPETAEFEELSWASDKLIEMAWTAPDLLWDMIPVIIKYDSSNKIIGAVGAGLLEDLMIYHGGKFIDRIESLSRKDPLFKKAINFTFLDEDDVSPAVYKRFSEIKNSIKGLA